MKKILPLLLGCVLLAGCWTTPTQQDSIDIEAIIENLSGGITTISELSYGTIKGIEVEEISLAQPENYDPKNYSKTANLIASHISPSYWGREVIGREYSNWSQTDYVIEFRSQAHAEPQKVIKNVLKFERKSDGSLMIYRLEDKNIVHDIYTMNNEWDMSLKETTVLSRNDDFMEDVKLVAQNEQIAKVTEDFEACGTMGSEYIKGKYTLQKGDVSILLGELEFVKGETNDKKLEHYTIGDQDIIVYYQHVDCASINVHFVLFDGTSLKKMKIYYPSVNTYEDSFAASDTLYKGNFSKDWVTMVAQPNGIGTPYESFFFINKDGNLENPLIAEFDHPDYTLIESTLEPERPDYLVSSSEDFYSIQPQFVDHIMLDRLVREHDMTEWMSYDEIVDAQEEGLISYDIDLFQGKSMKGMDNDITYEIYEFAEASTFEYIINVRKNGEQYFLFTHVVNYTISDDGRYLYLDNYTYDEYDDTFTNRWRIIDMETREEHEFDYSYCLMWNGGQWFQGDKFYTYGQANDVDNESYGMVESELCTYDIPTKKLNKYLTNLQRMACSVACPIDFMTFLPHDTNTLVVYRDDFAIVAGGDEWPKHTTLSMYKLDEVGEIDGNYHVTFFNPDERTDIDVSTIDYDMPLDRFFKFWKTSNQ